MKNHRLKLICFIFIFFLLGSSVSVCAWGFYAHKKINYIAVFSLPLEMEDFYKKNISYIVLRATAPDQRRYVVEGEAPRHYLDIDHYGRYPYENVPHSYKEAQEKFTEDTLMAHGIVPWHVETMYYRLRDAFAAKDRDLILKNSAEIGHYIADACVPLHASSNHNGQHTGQEGIHGLWESRIPELFEQKDFNLFVGHAQHIPNIRDYVWAMFLESAYLSDTVLAHEREVTQKMGEQNKYTITERGAAVIRTYTPEFTEAYMHSMGTMVEDRMRRSIKSIASIWVTAWIEAGQPSLDFEASTPIQDPELDSLIAKWQLQRDGKGFGRAHE